VPCGRQCARVAHTTFMPPLRCPTLYAVYPTRALCPAEKAGMASKPESLEPAPVPLIRPPNAWVLQSGHHRSPMACYATVRFIWMHATAHEEKAGRNKSRGVEGG
jgi:hypothetical protein